MTTETKIDKAAWERCGAVDRVISVLKLQFSSHLHSLYGSNSLYALDDEKLLEWNEVRHLQFSFQFVVSCLLRASMKSSSRCIQGVRLRADSF